ncbi:MAG TPA: CHRD domain-containing protein, partial [Rhodothermales bacterium]|nr:CHRD domain-containing protein [Rhodothermales bacterium]
GTAALALTDEGLRFFVTVDGLTGDIANAHFHQGATGVSGSVVRGIADDFEGNTASGLWTASDGEPLTDAMIQDLLAGNLYLNIHTDQFPGGEIRGQVLPTSGTALSATFSAAQQPGDVESDGSGTASIQLTDAGVLFFVTINDLSGDIANAHFHQGAAGVNGPVVRGIADDFEGNTAFGLWTTSDDQALTDALVQDLLTENLYINIHTNQFAGGEVRGQVRQTSGRGFSALLDADQETNDVTSDALGTAALTLTEAGLVFHVTVEGLSGDITNAHFHQGVTGVSGPPVRGIADDFEDNTASGIWTADDAEPLTDALIQDLLAGNLYLNIHTAANQPGEIRGQVLLDAGTNLTAKLTPAQAGNDAANEGRGTATLTLTDEGVAFRVTVDGLTGAIANAHFHQGAAGISGPVFRGIADDFEGNTASGLWTATDAEPLTDERIQDLLAGNLYFNIHTDQFPGGEIRGQIHVSEGTGLQAWLTNEQQTNEVTQEGSGTATLTLTEAGVLFDVTVDGLTGDIANAHFHQGAAGVNGSVVRGIADDFEGNTASGLWTATDAEPLTDALIQDLLAGNLYLNIHTQANPPGEIRGQVHLAGGIGAAVQLDPGQETNDVTSDGSGTAALTLTEAGLVFDLTATGLTGDITGAHFHQGAMGTSGPVVRGITDAFDGNTASGLWTASDDEPLTVDLMNELLAGSLYLNIHTAANQPGEIRGQVRPNGVVATAIEAIDAEIPEAFTLAQNYPNPFNPTTTIAFALPQSTHAVLTVYNLLGQQVAVLVNDTLPAGSYEVSFDASHLPSGVYPYRLEARATRQMRVMLLVK